MPKLVMLLVSVVLLTLSVVPGLFSGCSITSKECPIESRIEYVMGTLEYLLSGSRPVEGGAMTLVRAQFLDVVKTPISLRANFSRWNAAASDSRLTEDSMTLICVAWESSSFRMELATLLT